MTHAVGDPLPPFEIVADPEAMKAWAIFLADPNPIHLDVEVVKAKGLGDRVINQGPMNVAYLVNMLTAAFPGGRIEAMDTRFLDNVYADDRCIASGTITALAEGRLTCDYVLGVEGRGTVNSGTATILI